MSYLVSFSRAAFQAVFWLALAVAPVAAGSQEDTGRLAERQRQIAAEIERIEAEDGPYARELIEPLTALSLLHEEAGDYRLADPTTERLLQVIRANYGLYSLEQIASIRQLMSHELQRGNTGSAWALEQSLLRLAERNIDDVRSARILRDTADRRMSLLERYNAGELPPEITLGCYYLDISGRPPGVNALGTTEDTCHSGSRRQVRQRLIGEAQNYYSQAINILLENAEYSSDELPALLMDLAHSSHRYGNPPLGRRSLRYLVAYQATNSAPLLDRLDTLVHIADWALLYADGSRESEAALDQYERVLAELEDTPAARAWVDNAFSPEMPVRLPAFYANPLVTTERGSVGYIDVAFHIDTHGRSRQVRVLDATGNAPPSAEKRLKQLIQQSRFRPQRVDGRFADTDRIVVRYYIGESAG